MNRIVFVSALLSATALGMPSVSAWDFFPPNPQPPVSNCDTLCDPLRDDIIQDLEGFQKALNSIVDIDDANDIVQEAVNAGNLVNLDLDGFTLGTVEQSADVFQFSANLIDGGKGSTFSNLSQAATNVVNSVTGTTAWNIHQTVTNRQMAFNTILGGAGGYDADLTDGSLEDAMTQTAVNASNLVDLGTLKNEINQTSENSQTAINTAVFQSDTAYSYHYPFITTVDADIWDLGQSATNVTNNITVGAIDLANGCACDYEIDQTADAGQFAKNYLSALGDVNNIVQKATNVANSVGVPSDD